MRLLGWAPLLFNWWRNFYSETHMVRKQCKKMLGEDGRLQAEEKLGTDPTSKLQKEPTSPPPSPWSWTSNHNKCVCKPPMFSTLLLSCVSLFVTPWIVAHQAPLSIGFIRQEYWSGFPWPPPGNLPNPGIEPGFPGLQVDSLPSEPPGKPNAISVILWIIYYD